MSHSDKEECHVNKRLARKRKNLNFDREENEPDRKENIRKISVVDLTAEQEEVAMETKLNSDITPTGDKKNLGPWKYVEPVTPVMSSIADFTTKFPPGHFPEGRIFLNKLQPESTNEDEVCLKELVYPYDLSRALITTYTITYTAISDLFGEILENPHFEELIIISHHDMQRRVGGQEPEKYCFKSAVRSKITYISPEFPVFEQEKRLKNCRNGLQHSKLTLLRYPNYLRVIISSQNITNSVASQMLFVCDAPLQLPSEENEKGFGIDLAEFIDILTPSLQTSSVNFMIIAEWIRTCKSGGFSQVDKNYCLICSVPGNFSKDCKTFGLPRLAACIDSHNISVDQVDAYASSIGGLDSCLIPQLAQAVRISQENFSIIWPTFYQILQEEFLAAKSCMFLANDSLFQDGIQTTRFKPLMLNIERRGVMLHAKVICGYDSSGINFLYVGSHNLSQSAWGYWNLDSKGNVTSYSCLNFELGVLCFDKNHLASSPLPFLLTSQTYEDLAENLGRENASSLLSLGASTSSLSLITSRISKERICWEPFSARKFTELCQSSDLQLEISKHAFQILQASSLASVVVIFIRSMAELKSVKLQCLPSGVSLLCVEIATCRVGTLMFLFNLISENEPLRGSSLPFAVHYSISLDTLLSMSNSDIYPKRIVPSELLLLFSDSVKHSLVYSEARRGVFSFKSSCHQCAGCVSCLVLFPPMVSWGMMRRPRPVNTREQILKAISSEYDIFIFSEVYQRSSIYNESGKVRIIPGFLSFLVDFSKCIQLLDRRIVLLFLINIPEVGITKYIQEFSGESGYQKSLYREMFLQEGKAKNFVSKFEDLIQQVVGLKVVVQVKVSYLFKYGKKVIPPKQLLSTYAKNPCWNPEFLKPNTGYIRADPNLRSKKICIVGKSRVDRLTARSLQCKYYILKDLIFEWKMDREPHLVQPKIESKLNKEADEWLS